MGSTGEGSVTRWIGDLKSGGDSAAQHLWERYFERLVRLARKQLQEGKIGLSSYFRRPRNMNRHRFLP
jgi:ECF sigma factor